jgi:hypothetical protein
MTSGDITFTDLVFLSKDKNVDVISVEGLNLGPLYGGANPQPKHVGKKTYVSNHGIKISEKIVITWKYSDAGVDGKVMQAVIHRDKQGIPAEINDDSGSLRLVFSNGSWSAEWAVGEEVQQHQPNKSAHTNPLPAE